jgi:hypothetical protein
MRKYIYLIFFLLFISLHDARACTHHDVFKTEDEAFFFLTGTFGATGYRAEDPEWGDQYIAHFLRSTANAILKIKYTFEGGLKDFFDLLELDESSVRSRNIKNIAFTIWNQDNIRVKTIHELTPIITHLRLSNKLIGTPDSTLENNIQTVWSKDTWGLVPQYRKDILFYQLGRITPQNRRIDFIQSYFPSRTADDLSDLGRQIDSYLHTFIVQERENERRRERKIEEERQRGRAREEERRRGRQAERERLTQIQQEVQRVMGAVDQNTMGLNPHHYDGQIEGLSNALWGIFTQLVPENEIPSNDDVQLKILDTSRVVGIFDEINGRYTHPDGTRDITQKLQRIVGWYINHFPPEFNGLGSYEVFTTNCLTKEEGSGDSAFYNNFFLAACAAVNDLLNSKLQQIN